MAKSHSSRATRRDPPCVPADIRDQLNVAICVCATVVDALATEYNNEDAATTLQQCAVEPLRKIREALEALR